MPPRIVQQSRGAEKMRRRVVLHDALAIEFHMTHVKELVVGGKDVRNRPWYVEAFDDTFGLVSGFRLGL